MRKVAFFCQGYGGARAKMAEVVQQIFGRDCIDYYILGTPGVRDRSDLEVLQMGDCVHFWEEAEDVIPELLQHEYIHVWADNTKNVAPVVGTGEKMLLHKYDVHTMRGGDDPTERVTMLAKNIITIFINENHKNYLCGKYGLEHDRTAVIPNYAPLAWVPEVPKPQRKIKNTLVYYGGIITDLNSRFAYRYFMPLWKQFADAGVDIHAYPPSDLSELLIKTYEYPGIFLHHKVPHKQIFEEVSQYEVGFVGYWTEAPKAPLSYALASLPNKATDYMHAGIPTLCYEGGYMEDWTKNWGVNMHKEDDFLESFEKARDMEIDYPKWKEEYCMEAYTELIAELYERIKRIP